MTERTTPQHHTQAPVATVTQGDLGRRIEWHRTELGLTREQVAFRAGVAEEYVAHLVEPGVEPPGPRHRRAVTDPDEARHLAEHAYSTPWAGGERDLWVRIGPTVFTGRRIDVW
ncbi:helix-turn-helix domain-containing protein [Streptomyces diastatochromogenes]|uniref:HTH cro/C1-type domain-containing protein n=1 Tax=Streptomyces diastatochromogenes TaxID=42236 RepID=A0A233S7T2_STRDA|nr:hypothetical protein BEK98_28885 [Streptomyces diastatochromogenes]